MQPLGVDMTITQPLRDEHKELLPSIKDIGNLAESIDILSEVELRKRLKTVLDFLQKKLIPHALAEDQVLYPKIDDLAHFAQATKTMKYDHEEIAKLTSFISENMKNKHDLQKLLYQLSLLVALHFKKEEEIYLPFLDENLNKKDAKYLFEQIESAARKIKEKQN